MERDPTRLIERLGGPTAVAKLFQIRPPSVIGWREHGIPSARLQTLQALAAVRADIAEALAAAGYSLDPIAKPVPANNQGQEAA